MRVVNIHPALPGAFPGTQAIERAFEAWRQGRIDRTGVMIHFVPDEGVDDGPVIATAEVAIEAGDDPASLEKKIHETEHRLLTETLARLANAQ
jgi:phosphoribosylglycinamide formyltransferase-1